MGTEKNEPTAQSGEEALSFAAVVRRRMLLKGAGKGVAIMAATVPIQTLATQSVLTFDGLHQCTVSGAMSGVHSATPTNTPTCKGNTPTYFQTLINWPGTYVAGNNPPTTATVTNTNIFVPSGTVTFNQNDQFKKVFGGSVNTRLIDILTLAPASNDAVWVTALLNAIKNPASFNFPYTPFKVVEFYNSAQAAQALDFFKNYMQKG